MPRKKRVPVPVQRPESSSDESSAESSVSENMASLKAPEAKGVFSSSSSSDADEILVAAPPVKLPKSPVRVKSPRKVERRPEGEDMKAKRSKHAKATDNAGRFSVFLPESPVPVTDEPVSKYKILKSPVAEKETDRKVAEPSTEGRKRKSVGGATKGAKAARTTRGRPDEKPPPQPRKVKTKADPAAPVLTSPEELSGGNVRSAGEVKVQPEKKKATGGAKRVSKAKQQEQTVGGEGAKATKAAGDAPVRETGEVAVRPRKRRKAQNGGDIVPAPDNQDLNVLLSTAETYLANAVSSIALWRDSMLSTKSLEPPAPISTNVVTWCRAPAPETPSMHARAIFKEQRVSRRIARHLFWPKTAIELGLEQSISEHCKTLTEWATPGHPRFHILLGPSGSGKTRSCLEFLCKQRGFIFCASSLGDHAKDFSECLLLSANHPWRVQHYLRCLILSRRYVMWKASQGANKYDTPAQWLFAQLHPAEWFGRDVFLFYFRFLAAKATEESVSEMYNEIVLSKDLAAGDVPCVFDDVQALMRTEKTWNTPIGTLDSFFAQVVVQITRMQMLKGVFAGTAFPFATFAQLLFGMGNDPLYDVNVCSMQFRTKNSISKAVRVLLSSPRIIKQVEDLPLPAESSLVDVDAVVGMLSLCDNARGRPSLVGNVVDSVLGGTDVAVAVEALNNLSYKPVLRSHPLFHSGWGISLDSDIHGQSLREICRALLKSYEASGIGSLSCPLDVGLEMLDRGFFVRLPGMGEVTIVVELREQIVAETLRVLLDDCIDISGMVLVPGAGLGAERVVGERLLRHLYPEVPEKPQITFSTLVEALREDSEGVRMVIPEVICGPDAVFINGKKRTIHFVSMHLSPGDVVDRRQFSHVKQTTELKKFYHLTSGWSEGLEIPSGKEDSVRTMIKAFWLEKRKVVEEIVSERQYVIHQLVVFYPGRPSKSHVKALPKEVTVITKDSHPFLFADLLM